VPWRCLGTPASTIYELESALRQPSLRSESEVVHHLKSSLSRSEMRMQNGHSSRSTSRKRFISGYVSRRALLRLTKIHLGSDHGFLQRATGIIHLEQSCIFSNLTGLISNLCIHTTQLPWYVGPLHPVQIAYPLVEAQIAHGRLRVLVGLGL
jgi:hypothetical protein